MVVLHSLCSFITLLCSNQVPSDVVPHLRGATLYRLKKKSGGLRPIADGEILRRLSSKCISKAVFLEAFPLLSSLLFGVGASVGCEAIVNSVSSIQGDNSVSPDCKWVVQVDFSNAFNSINRSVMLEEICSQIPSMAAWMECCYCSQPFYILADILFLAVVVSARRPFGSPGFFLISSSCYQEN